MGNSTLILAATAVALATWMGRQVVHTLRLRSSESTTSATAGTHRVLV